MEPTNVFTRLTLDELTRGLSERPDRPQTGVWMLLQQGQDLSNKEVAFREAHDAEWQNITSGHNYISF
jgi:hypothetical protein